MLIEINLLGKKEKKNYTPLAVLFVLIIGFIIALLLLFLSYNKANFQVDSLEKELDITKSTIAVTQKKLQGSAEPSAIQRLEEAIQGAQSIPISTVKVLDHVSELLPERGFIMNFSYSDQGPISLQVQFDTKREAVYYYRALLDSSYTAEVTLQNLTAQSIGIEEQAAEIIPRYVGNFTITIDAAALRAEEGGES